MIYKVVRAELRHAAELAPRLREQDLLELRACSARRPIELLLQSVAISELAWAALYDGRVCALWGCNDLGGGRGGAWLLGSDDMYRSRREAMWLSRLYVARMHERFPILCNFVDARNTVSRRWLEALGFRPLFVHPAYGVEQRPFIFYESNINVRSSDHPDGGRLRTEPRRTAAAGDRSA